MSKEFSISGALNVYVHFIYTLRSCYEINYTDCAGWFFEIKEENAAVPGYGEAF